MTMKSIMCANLRIAPLQVCGVGHSVSTFGSLIDYFISGADVELPEGAEANYSERLVLLPGYGIIHNPIHYARRNPPVTSDPMVINCPWYAQKTNHEMLELLARIDRETYRALQFRFYPGGSVGRDNGHVAFARDVGRVLAPGTFTVYPGMPYDDYMTRMEEGALTIDAYPFGGCNTVADSLYLGKVTLTYQGRSWYNRIGSQMLLSVGLDELVAHDDESYVAKAVRLIDDDTYRESLEARMRELPIMETIFDNRSQHHFKAAIDYLVANHAALAAENSRAPLRID
jgi:predicted O-linked N-acetylglucosamine transferase (SPINDLY family)